MAASHDQESDELLARAAQGDEAATAELFAGHRARLRRMVAVRLDPRLAARIDASDVVQDTFLEASRALGKYVRDRPLPFYPWLRQLAWQRVYDLHVQHVYTQKRSVDREAGAGMALSDESVMRLAEQAIASGTTPSMQLIRKELRGRVREALSQMPELDREVLIMRYLEQLSAKEIAAIVGGTVSAINMRHLRALRRLRGLLDESLRDS